MSEWDACIIQHFMSMPPPTYRYTNIVSFILFGWCILLFDFPLHHRFMMVYLQRDLLAVSFYFQKFHQTMIKPMCLLYADERVSWIWYFQFFLFFFKHYLSLMLFLFFFYLFNFSYTNTFLVIKTMCVFCGCMCVCVCLVEWNECYL